MLNIHQDWTPKQDDFIEFAAVSGDTNPIHLDPFYCARTDFKKPVSHGMLLYAKLWGLLTAARPDFVHSVQSMMFPNPAFADDPLILSLVERPSGIIDMRATRKIDKNEVFIGEATLTCSF